MDRLLLVLYAIFFCKAKESELVLEKYLYSNTANNLSLHYNLFFIDINMSYVLHQGPLSINSFTNIKP